MNKEELKQKVHEFPDAPGIYIMRNGDGDEIYIGKAVSLTKRTASYFRPCTSMEKKTMVLMDHVRDIDYVRTDSEVEALLLESRLIKDIKPRYNIDLKWGERYPYLAVIKTDDFPRVEITRDAGAAEPADQREILFKERFTGVKELRKGIHVLQRIFRFRTCRLVIYAADRKRNYARPCLLYHIKRCTAPCAARISEQAYRDDINRFISFLNGGKEDVCSALEKEMRTASEEQRYEDAARLRDEITLLKHISDDGGLPEYDPGAVPLIAPEESLVLLQKELGLPYTPAKIEGVDISHTGGRQHTGSIVTFLNGMPYTPGYRRFRIKGNTNGGDADMIHEVVSRRISGLIRDEEDLPDIMLVDGGRDQVQAAFSVFREYGFSGDVYALGIAKKNESLYIPGRKDPLSLPKTSPALKLLRYVRDEAHRFARLYHTLLRKKEFER